MKWCAFAPDHGRGFEITPMIIDNDERTNGVQKEKEAETLREDPSERLPSSSLLILERETYKQREKKGVRV
ncbi:unnamed protein product [Linum trigynum]|uniref:Uncharacterized protein n=1 Tax=Linum trigynum TaxID=586398 RepID=A0AAV2E149_9ROSI